MFNEIINKEDEEFKEPKEEKDPSKSNLELIKDMNVTNTNNVKIVTKIKFRFLI